MGGTTHHDMNVSNSSIFPHLSAAMRGAGLMYKNRGIKAVGQKTAPHQFKDAIGECPLMIFNGQRVRARHRANHDHGTLARPVEVPIPRLAEYRFARIRLWEFHREDTNMHRSSARRGSTTQQADRQYPGCNAHGRHHDFDMIPLEA